MMLITNKDYFILFVTSYFLVGVLTPLIRRVAIKSEIFDEPDSAHKSHKFPVPYLGGVAIMIGVIVVSYSSVIKSQSTSEIFWLMNSILGPALILGLIGLLDDIKNLSPLTRFIAQSSVGVFTSFMLILTNTVGNPTGSVVADSVVTVIWVVGVCNAINFFDNLDGGAAGTIAISSMTLTILSLNQDQDLIAALATVIFGASLGFLIWNKNPAKIYMGDAGSLFLGALIAILTIRFEPKTGYQITSLATPIFLLAVPILDTTVAVTSRIRRGVSPFTGGQDHLSHRLIKMGFNRRAAVLTLWSITAIFCFFAFAISAASKIYEIPLMLMGIVIWILLFILFTGISFTWQSSEN